MKTLLQRAKSAGSATKRKITKGHIELAIAWVKNEVQIKQVAKAIRGSSTSAYTLLSNALKIYMIDNNILNKKNK